MKVNKLSKMILFGASTLVLLVLFYCVVIVNLIVGSVIGVACGVALTLFFKAAEDYLSARKWGENKR